MTTTVAVHQFQRERLPWIVRSDETTRARAVRGGAAADSEMVSRRVTARGVTPLMQTGEDSARGRKKIEKRAAQEREQFGP